MTIIVPEENETCHDYSQVLNEEFNRHGKCVLDFCEKNKISLTDFDFLDPKNENSYGLCKMVSVLGYLAIQHSDDFTLIYIPSVISPHQYSWMKKNKPVFKRLENRIFIFSYYIEDNQIIEEKPNEFHEENMIDVLYDELKSKKGNWEVDYDSRIRNR